MYIILFSNYNDQFIEVGNACIVPNEIKIYLKRPINCFCIGMHYRLILLACIMLDHICLSASFPGLLIPYIVCWKQQ